MNNSGNILFLLILLHCVSGRAQETPRKVSTIEKSVVMADSAKQQNQISDSIVPYKPDPVKTIRMGAIIPGYGQIMNKKYWKLPIVYGGFAALGYAIYWNATQYNKYTKAYVDITDSDESTNSHLTILPKGYTIDSYGGIGTYTATLKTAQQNYRRNRDLSIIGTIGFYALTLVDAYVDAQLYDFDISPDLSIRIKPVFLENHFARENVFAMQCQLRLK